MPSPEKLAAFTAWAQAHITGDETAPRVSAFAKPGGISQVVSKRDDNGQAQIFLDRLFIAFGHAGSLDVGGEPEFRVRKAAEDGGGTSFAEFIIDRTYLR